MKAEELRELDAAADVISETAHMDSEALKDHLIVKYMKDEDFADAFDKRQENPHYWATTLEEIAASLPARPERALFSAVRAAREYSGPVARDRFSDIGWNRLSNDEFARAKAEGFAAAQSGELKPESMSYTGGKYG